MANSNFGLVCEGLLQKFQKNQGTDRPFHAILYEEERLAKLAAIHVPPSVHQVDPEEADSYLLRVDQFKADRPKLVYLRPFDLPNPPSQYHAWTDFENGVINQLAVDAIEECLHGWINWDAANLQAASLKMERENVLILPSGKIVERYDLTSKQVRDWSKDVRKPFIERIDGTRDYKLDPNHPTLVSLEKTTRSNKK